MELRKLYQIELFGINKKPCGNARSKEFESGRNLLQNISKKEMNKVNFPQIFFTMPLNKIPELF